MFRFKPFVYKLFILQIYFFTFFSIKYEYVILGDGGSTGTRLYGFRYNDLDHIEELNKIIWKDGKPVVLSDYGIGKKKSLMKLEEDLKDMIDQVFDSEKNEKYIPRKEIKNVRFYLGATAGLRLLEIEQVNEVLKTVRNVVSEFGFKDYSVNLLSGEEEGLFGWIHLNHVLKSNYDDYQTLNAIFDMGGASTQITFAPIGEILANKWTLKVRGKGPVNLYTHSFLRYGTDQAFMLSLEKLIEINGAGGNIDHPCLWTGDSYVYGITTFVGVNDLAGCKTLVNQILNWNNKCHFNQSGSKSCSFDSQYIPTIPDTKTLYAVSSFFFPMQGLFIDNSKFNISSSDLTYGTSGLTIKDVVDEGDSFCVNDLAYAETHSYYGPTRCDTSILTLDECSKLLREQCFKVYYTTTILRDAYHIKEDSTNLKFAFKVIVDGDKFSISWMIGMLLYHVNVLDMGEQYENTITNKNTSIAGLATFLTIFILLCLFCTFCLGYVVVCRLIKNGTSNRKGERKIFDEILEIFAFKKSSEKLGDLETVDEI